MPTPTRSTLASRLEPGEVDRLAATATDHRDPVVRRAAAEALRILAGPVGGPASASTPAELPAGVQRVTFAEAAALAARQQATEEERWQAFITSTFGDL